MKETIYIYHTNDLHSQFEQWPALVYFLKQSKKTHEGKQDSYFYFDIGDHADRCHPMTEGLEGKGSVALLNQVKVDGVTIGNNEGITFSKRQLNNLYEKAEFPVLVANLFEKNGQRPSWAKAYKILETSKGTKLGVIGVTIPYDPFYDILGWKIEDPFQMLPSLLEELKEKVDIVVLLSHLGLSNDEFIAETIKGIDVILGAHTHHLLEKGKRVKETLIGQAGKFGSHVGQVKISFDRTKQQILDINIDTFSISSDNADSEAELLLGQLNLQGKQRMNEYITSLDEPLMVDWLKESPAIKLLAEALKEWCGTEYSMVNSGLILESLPKGNITLADIHRICPHPINPCIVTISGSNLKETIHHAFTGKMKKLELKGYGFRGKILGHMVFDGIEVKTKKWDDEEEHVVSIQANGEEIQANKEYRIATLDMFTFGRLYPAIARTENKQYFMPELIREILLWKLKKIGKHTTFARFS